jgi:four helix bundle protein
MAIESCLARIGRPQIGRPSTEEQMQVKSFRDLVVWQKSVDCIEEVYRLSAKFPADERYRLTDQIRSSALSIASNIAEGSGRFTSRDYLNFISQSRGSVKETESDLLIAVRLKFLFESDAENALALTDEVSRMLFQLRSSIRAHARRAGS